MNNSTVANPVRVAGTPHKPLDNPRRPKPSFGADIELARELGTLLAAMPSTLDSRAGEQFPLLSALARADHDGNAQARQLLFIAARVHHWADERRTAEYLLRNRQSVLDGRRDSASLISAARCAAEMDVRRVRLRETPRAPEVLDAGAAGDGACARLDDVSVGEHVVDFLRSVIGAEPMTARVQERFLTAVTVALEVSERHALKRGELPSVIAMRSDARPEGRLSSYLLHEFGDAAVARNLARLLVGGCDTPIETSLLWWAACRHGEAGDVPADVRAGWQRDLIGADPELRSARSRRCQRACRVETQPGKSAAYSQRSSSRAESIGCIAAG
jgi:hypothetical protein